MTETRIPRNLSRNPGTRTASLFARALLPVVAILLIGADDPATDAKKDVDQLQGEWTGVSLEMRGKATDNTEWKLYVRGDEWTVTEGGSGQLVATVKIDPSKKPKAMDLTYKMGGKERSSLAIYKLDGDTLTLCRTWAPLERPKEFKTTEESGILIVWKRAKK